MALRVLKNLLYNDENVYYLSHPFEIVANGRQMVYDIDRYDRNGFVVVFENIENYLSHYKIAMLQDADRRLSDFSSNRQEIRDAKEFLVDNIYLIFKDHISRRYAQLYEHAFGELNRVWPQYSGKKKYLFDVFNAYKLKLNMSSSKIARWAKYRNPLIDPFQEAKYLKRLKEIFG